jgi:hypothetical protein
MKKYIKNDCIGVLYSPGYGAGWSSWNSQWEEILCMDYDIVKAVDEGDNKKAIKIAEEKCPDIYTGGGDNLTIEWVPMKSLFRITEYDGYESVEIMSNDLYMYAYDEEYEKTKQEKIMRIKRTVSIRKNGDD